MGKPRPHDPMIKTRPGTDLSVVQCSTSHAFYSLYSSSISSSTAAQNTCGIPVVYQVRNRKVGPGWMSY